MASITFPSTVMWVFNPTYIKISGSAASSVKVTVGTKTIDVDLFNGSADIPINGLAQLNFTSPETTRSMTLTISVSGGETGSTSILAIWGAVGYGDTYYQFARNGVRHVYNFVNFPFSVDILTTTGFTTKTVVSSLTDTTTSPAGSIKTIVVPRYETEGVYLRWVDRFGFTQYYLFSTGDLSLKTSLSGYSIEKMLQIVGTGYAKHNRALKLTSSKTLKASAINLDEETLEYVSSIVGSPIVDMYLDNGKWLPVSISAGTYRYSKHHLKVLQDFDINISLPDEHSQIL